MTTFAARCLCLYERLWKAYGPQGWWPVAGPAGRPPAAVDKRGYHPLRYRLPDTPDGRFEVAVGAVLTQNTAWQNVEKAIEALKKEGLLSPSGILGADMSVLVRTIRSSGYFNQKANKLKLLAAFLKPAARLDGRRPPRREELLSVWGIGEETADSILLYAFQRPFFVVDAYTRRLLVRLGWIDEKAAYSRIQELFHQSLPHRSTMYNEYHALIVEHAKRHCRKKPLCPGCPAGRLCRFRRAPAAEKG